MTTKVEVFKTETEGITEEHKNLKKTSQEEHLLIASGTKYIYTKEHLFSN